MRNNLRGISLLSNRYCQFVHLIDMQMPSMLPLFTDYRPHALACALSTEMKSIDAEEDCDLRNWKPESGI